MRYWIRVDDPFDGVDSRIKQSVSEGVVWVEGTFRLMTDEEAVTTILPRVSLPVGPGPCMDPTCMDDTEHPEHF
jgi:hypothetical protein